MKTLSRGSMGVKVTVVFGNITEACALRRLEKSREKSSRIAFRLIELPRSKLTGDQNIAMRIYPKAVTPECFNRGPVTVSPGFPIQAFGND